MTFDDGPIPEVTPWVLDVLEEYNVKATFFCVGDNVRRHSEVYRDVLNRGHRVGNHTFNHLQGWKSPGNKFVRNVQLASHYIHSKLFRPPHGHMYLYQLIRLQRMGYKAIYWDVVTRDYNQKLSGERILRHVKKYTRNGSIIVFHDSLKAEKNLRYALPHAIEWLKAEGYQLETINFEELK